MQTFSAGIPLVSIDMLLPIIGSFFVFLGSEKLSKIIAPAFSLITLLISFYFIRFMDLSSLQNIYLFEDYKILPELGISYKVGVDGLSYVMTVLSNLVSFVAILWSTKDIQISRRLKEYFILFLLTQSFLIGVFTSFDLIVFFVFYELTLIPMIFIIGAWGYKLRLYSAYKFFIYIFISSLFLLLGILTLSVMHYEQGLGFTTDYLKLFGFKLPLKDQEFLFWLFFIAFAVKTPLVPFHTWLPDAHGEAPTAGSVVLAAILLKMGSYAFLRFNIGLFPDASKALWKEMVFIGVLTIIYSSWMTIIQNNIKRFVAYSSVSHMGFIFAAMFLLNFTGFRASTLEMIGHGFTSASLFMIAGFIYNRLHTFNIKNLAGSVRYMPIFAVIVVLTAYSAMGLPGGSSFWGKFLTIMGAREHSFKLSLIILVGAFFSAIYLLYMLKSLFLETRTEGSLLSFTDLRGVKLLAFLLVVIPMFILGLFPFLFYDIFDKSLLNILNLVSLR